MKRKIAFVLLFVFLFSCFAGVAVYAVETNGGEYELSRTEMELECNSALLMDSATGTVLYSKNESDEASPASVTKIMTLLLVMEALRDGVVSLEDNVFVSSNAASMGGSQVFLEEGERISLEDLIKCTVIASGNDSAVALAEHIAGSENAFVQKMNERASSLGLKNTRFENVTGLDDTTTDHVSSAYDIAIMSKELISHELITKYSSMWQDSIRDGEFVLTNTNRLVRYYDGCNGLKTGSTDKAGFCVSVSAKRGELELIAVVMGAPTRDIRNNIARELLDYGFSSYAVYAEEEKMLEYVDVLGSHVTEAPVYSDGFVALVNKADLKKINRVYTIPENICAPLESGARIGQVEYKVGDKTIGVSDIFIKNELSRIDYFDIFIKMLKNCLFIE